ncbi:hypothetical protein ACGF0J_09055 [Nonomuraea sp. NPDC047897]|uniref:hypothetical protein n=1 Tax=Nonomuraea sp. NPDC047897 TaxID=3364346 RepID=UPI0037231EF8
MHPEHRKGAGARVNLERLTGQEILARTPHLVKIYRAAFGGPPWHEDERAADAFAERLTADAQRPGFAAVLASDIREPAGFGTAWRTQSPSPRVAPTTSSVPNSVTRWKRGWSERWRWTNWR